MDRYVDKSEKELNFPDTWKTQNNKINTTVRTDVPTVVFIERVEKKGHSRMTSMNSTYRRNLTTLTTPSIKEPPRSPFSLASELYSHR